MEITEVKLMVQFSSPSLLILVLEYEVTFFSFYWLFYIILVLVWGINIWGGHYRGANTKLVTLTIKKFLHVSAGYRLLDSPEASRRKPWCSSFSLLIFRSQSWRPGATDSMIFAVVRCDLFFGHFSRLSPCETRKYDTHGRHMTQSAHKPEGRPTTFRLNLQLTRL